MTRCDDLITQGRGLYMATRVQMLHTEPPAPRVARLNHTRPPRRNRAAPSLEARLHQLEEERERISRDLHDSVLQSLYAVGLKLRASKLLNPEAPTRAIEHLEQAVAQLDEAVEELRGFLRADLRHDRVAESGLERGLRSLALSMTAASGVTPHLSFHPLAEQLLPRQHVREVLHIVREAISNTIRHAQATDLRLTVEVLHDRLR